MWQVVLFAAESQEELDQALRSLSSVATCRAESGFYQGLTPPYSARNKQDCGNRRGDGCAG